MQGRMQPGSVLIWTLGLVLICVVVAKPIWGKCQLIHWNGIENLNSLHEWESVHLAFISSVHPKDKPCLVGLWGPSILVVNATHYERQNRLPERQMDTLRGLIFYVLCIQDHSPRLVGRIVRENCEAQLALCCILVGRALATTKFSLFPDGDIRIISNPNGVNPFPEINITSHGMPNVLHHKCYAQISPPVLIEAQRSDGSSLNFYPSAVSNGQLVPQYFDTFLSRARLQLSDLQLFSDSHTRLRRVPSGLPRGAAEKFSLSRHFLELLEDVIGGEGGGEESKSTNHESDFPKTDSQSLEPTKLIVFYNFHLKGFASVACLG